MILNVKSDTLIYLTNSLIFAGLQDNISINSTIFLSPVICLLTAFLMKLGLGKISIFIVTGVIDIVGIFSMYVLLKYRFNRLFSLCGAVLFASANCVLFCWADGGLDISVLSLSVLTFIFLILAVHENPKYYMIAFPCLIIAIFTKYTAFFIIPLMLLYYLSEKDLFNAIDLFISDRESFKQNAKDFIHSDEFKYLLIGILMALILFVAFCFLITSFGSGLSFITQSNDAANGFSDTKYIGKKNFDLDDRVYVFKFVELFNLPLSIFGFNLSTFILIIIIIAISINLISYVMNSEIIGELKERRVHFKTEKFDNYLKYLLVVLMITFIVGLYFNHMIANISMLVGIVIIFSFLEKLPINKKFYSMHFLMIAWLLVYFIFFSKITIKSERYLISCIPPLVYFVVWAIENIFDLVEQNFDFIKYFDSTYIKNTTFEFSDTRKGLILKIILILFIVVLMFGSVTYNTEFKYTTHDNKELEDLYDFLIDYDSDYLSKNISANNSYCARYGTWYTHSNVYVNKTHGVDPIDDYVISIGELKTDDYHTIYTADNDVRIYQRNY